MSKKPAPKTCPGCGGQMDYRSRLCKNCYGVAQAFPNRFDASEWHERIDKLDAVWICNFVGLFLGEGSVFFSRGGKSKTVTCSLGIALRSDDKPMLEDIHLKLGGSLYDDKKYNRVFWKVSTLARVEAVLRLILGFCYLPAKKLDDVRLVLEFIDWRFSVGFRLTDEDKAVAESFVEQMRTIRAIKEPSG